MRIALIIILFTNPYSLYSQSAWIRINLLGYSMNGSKVAVLGSKEMLQLKSFDLVDAQTGKKTFTGKVGNSFGSYGPFNDSYRLDFSSFTKKGRYILRSGGISSPPFTISNDVYAGKADFCLKYMRQQRSGFNPFLKDSCHTHDGYTLYAPVADSTHIDAVGGWHDATDYLQYSTTSANAAYHLLAAYRDFPNLFADTKNASGLDGKNNIADVLDEAKWGLDWLIKMHPQPGWIFNQLGDDRDHSGMRLPKEDSAYGKGYERPVYFCNGKPQVRGKFMNNSTGAASTAGKFAAAFGLGSELFYPIDAAYSNNLWVKSGTALLAGMERPGVAQTASVRSPYIYAEDNWKDDMELGVIAYYKGNKAHSQHLKKTEDPIDVKDMFNGVAITAYEYATDEPITPWLGADTAKHYQWYPFINIGHYELAKLLKDKRRDTIIGYYKQGIEKVWAKSKQNAFYRGVPFIWCSNNLTVSFAIQCYWYRKLTNDNTYLQLEQSCFDWIFGCNPWGTSMVYGLPQDGDTPIDPHSSFTHLYNYPVDGGLVDGPVYTSIYNNLLGIALANEDEYAGFQSGLAVYHDDVGDYSTNEPTMDGTASLIYLLAAMQDDSQKITRKSR
jgi:endoglucanase